ncbi:MAG TPA: circadian clock protein KaiC [Solirubrobacteraceae bacterium]|nr:circadian clock protein KaiC [Solirubrobacteraceae bacterium]
MSARGSVRGVERLEVGIPGFDVVAGGGIPANRSTLIAGTAGSGKTLFGVQYLISGLERFDQGGVYVTFDEPAQEIVRNVANLGWDLNAHAERGRLALVDVAAVAGEEIVEAGQFDFIGLLSRLERAIERTGAIRVVFDSLTGIFPQFADHNVIRGELHRITTRLRNLGVTTLMTAERSEEYGPVGRYGVEEFVADNVVILRHPLSHERRRRTVEILKFRGAPHHKGEFPFSIDGRSGITVIPLAQTGLKIRALTERTSIGKPRVDEMCGGGIFRDSIVMVSGATGTGKTMMVTEFLAAGLRAGERGLFYSFEESRPQILRNAASWGVDFGDAEREGTLRIDSRYPERLGLEDLLVEMRHQIEDFRPTRLALDSLSVLDRVSSGASFREFVVGMTSLIKEFELVAMCTNTTGVGGGKQGPGFTQVSTITDAIILLRYVEIDSAVHRCLTILKMRGSAHDKTITEYEIDHQGMQVLGPLTRGSGILTGAPVADEQPPRLD